MKVIKNIEPLPHQTCLNRVTLLSLQKRWLKGDVKGVDKIISALGNWTGDDLCTASHGAETANGGNKFEEKEEKEGRSVSTQHVT